MRHLIVDGYNVLHAETRYRELAKSDVDTARARLVEDVAAYAAGDARVFVVFDGGGNPASDGRPHHVAGVAVIFSPVGVDADSVIESLAYRFREEGHAVVVVTSDAQTQYAVMGAGAIRMSSAEFSRDRAESAQEASRDRRRCERSARLEDRIDPPVRDVMWRWARGG